MSSDIEKYKEIYINDMREHLQNMSRSFVELENDPGNIDLLNEIFRAAHTIKGNSATMTYHDVAGLAHGMENLLDKIRNNEIVIDQNIMDTLFEGFDTIESMIDSISNNEERTDPGPVIEKINKISTKPDTFQQETRETETVDEEPELSVEELRSLADAINEGKTVYEILVTFDETCGLKSAKSRIVIRNLEKFGERIAVYPPEEIIKQTNPEKFHILLASGSEIDILKESVLSVSEISGVNVKLFRESHEENTEFDIGSLEEPEITREDSAVQVTSLPQAAQAKEKPAQKIQNVRVDIRQLDSLMNRVGELMINKIGLEHVISEYSIPELNEYVGHLNRIVEELHQEVVDIRMVPVDQLFNKYPRIIRDLSKSCGKKVRLVIEGGDIELDRTVLDGINDPMVHILRNSVDHGIETQQHRSSIGKPEEGTVMLQAKREKNHVIIRISDDGAGIAPEVVKKTAILRGLISEAEAAEMSDNEIIYLIFSPGFSTSDRITDISGRGVGMDVVKRDIERLGGSVKIFSRPGDGTSLELKLPLTLAIVKALVVRVGNETYVLPLNNVVESAIINNSQIKTVDKKETIILRDEVIPLVRLDELFDIENTTPPDGNQFMVVVEYEARHVGLIVDELVDQQEVVIKSLGHSLGRVQGFAGSTIIKNGKVTLILDINSLFNMI